ncbi:hypothetical protein [Caldinitratiruptor microaerophilus]|uniref:Uncharacterized protein n=1 Tax=Caldinitratiruptor microaerophilus TaxID=671077 RepID=A0AA35CHI4_9FIRM|nr:hypothetical protein [Caldinitratiruptor microaerophilus]BDG59084.1 hypothetical protein caldi_01740 [Caldinitratiruptor microaerophilus]
MGNPSDVPPGLRRLAERVQGPRTAEDEQLLRAVLEQVGAASLEELKVRAAAALGIPVARLEALLSRPQELTQLLSPLLDRAGPDADALRAALEQAGLRLPPARSGPGSTAAP